MKLLLTGAGSVDPAFLPAVEDTLGAPVLLGDGKDEQAIEEDELTGLRGFAAEVEVRGGPPPGPYPTPQHYPALAHIDASREQTAAYPHLIYVTGSFGVYVPADFETPRVLANLTLIGSLTRLIAELETLAAHLKKRDGFDPENRAWLALSKAAKQCEVNRLVLGFA